MESKEKRIKNQLLSQEAMGDRGHECVQTHRMGVGEGQSEMQGEGTLFWGNRVRNGMIGHLRRGKITYLHLMYIPLDIDSTLSISPSTHCTHVHRRKKVRGHKEKVW